MKILSFGDKIYNHLYVRVILLLKRAGLKYLKRKSDTNIFVILCSARTGSTWLHTLLNSHPNIISLGEIAEKNSLKDFLISRKVNAKFEGFMECFTEIKTPSFIEQVGIKAFYDSPKDEEILQSILKNKSINIILLTRESKLEQYVSYQNALASEKWSYSRSSSANKIEVDPQKFDLYCQEQKTKLDILLDQLKGHSVFFITYEELASSQKLKLAQIQKFLGVRPTKLRSVLKKQSSLPISEQIENWEEIKDKL